MSKTLEDKTATSSTNRTALQSSGVSLPKNLVEEDKEESQVVSQDKPSTDELVKKVHEARLFQDVRSKNSGWHSKGESECPSCGSTQIISS